MRHFSVGTTAACSAIRPMYHDDRPGRAESGNSKQGIRSFARRLPTVAKKTQKEAIKGTLIRGADGALYFVQDDQRWAHRLKDEYTKEARALLDEKGFIANPDEFPAFHGSGLVRKGAADEIEVELNRLAALGRHQPREE